MPCVDASRRGRLCHEDVCCENESHEDDACLEKKHECVFYCSSLSIRRVCSLCFCVKLVVSIFLIGCSKCGRGTLCLSTRCVVCVVFRLSPKRAFPLLSRCRVCDALLARSPFSSYPASSYPRTHSLSSTSFSLLQVLVC